MAESVVSSTVATLGNLLNQEANFLLGVEDQVELLKEELSWMQCFLKDADSKQDEDKTVRKWVADVRDAAYDAEDVIETFALKIASRRREGIINVLNRSASIFSEGRKLHQVGSEIKAIRNKLSELSRRSQTYGLKELRQGEGSSSSYERQRELRRSYPHIVEQNVVGLEGNIKELVTNLVAEDKHFRVLSIYGMGGLGKTTLAKKIYHHGEVRRHFDYFAWAYISQKCRRREVWQGILFSLTSLSDKQSNEIINMTDDQLAPKLHQILKEKKCLVILDDIWSIQDWNSLSAAFPKEETSTKILLTSRNKEVASHADPRGFHHEPQCLNDEESWELLQKIAIFGREDFKVDKRMEELAKAMVKHCGGLPLAIIVLGGILTTKYSSSDWQTVHENIKPYLRRGKGLGEEHLGVSDVLALSYSDLPTELKPCFLYLSHFPEDSEINVDKLIRMWVAEGFTALVQHSREEKEEEESMEDVAERYLNELIQRCMVLIGERDASLRTKTCRMHDLMRDFCLLKAKEENFLDNIDRGDNNDDISSSSSTAKIRRLAVNLHGEGCRFPLKCIKNPHLRSLLCFYDFSFKRWRLEEPVFDNLKLLRLLDFEGAEFRKGNLPKYIGKLIHLRFLSLRDAELLQLPVSLGNLRCLQTLDLFISDKVVHVPNVIWKMEHLRHLYLPIDCDDKTKLQLGNLKKLRTLVNFPAGNCDVGDLLNLTNLRELSIRRSFLIKDFRETFKLLSSTLKHLRSFVLVNNEKIDVRQLVSSSLNLNELRLNVQIEELPYYHQFPQNITNITLRATGLKEDPMITLERLPNLRILSLDENAFLGKEILCSREGFPLLHSLLLHLQRNLEIWRVEEGAMPNLCHLEISRCRQLKTFPDGFRFIKTLQELEIKWMPASFKDKLVQGGEDFYKIQHVSSLIFQQCDIEW